MSKPPNYLACNHHVSGVTGDPSGSDKFNIHNNDGPISTKHHANWNSMGLENCKKAKDKVSRLGISKRKGKPANPCDFFDKENQITQLCKANTTHKKIITGFRKEKYKSLFDDNTINIDNAGNAFGSRSKKAKKWLFSRYGVLLIIVFKLVHLYNYFS